MMGALLGVGISAVVAGILALLYGVSIKEFSFGNAMMIVGTVLVGTGMIMMGLCAVLGELRNISRRLAQRSVSDPRPRPILPAPGALSGPPVEQALPDAGGPGNLLPSAPENPPPAVAMPPWREEPGPRDRARPAPMPSPSPPLEVGPPPRPSRNLMFSSSTRKQRERAQRSAEGEMPETPSATLSPEAADAPGFDAAWPRTDRTRPESARGSRTPSTFPEPVSGPEHGGGRPEVTVVKSGVVDGMAYSLFSDGSIEAQMPEGMMRFGSVDELRAHLDQRP